MILLKQEQVRKEYLRKDELKALAEIRAEQDKYFKPYLNTSLEGF